MGLLDNIVGNVLGNLLGGRQQGGGALSGNSLGALAQQFGLSQADCGSGLAKLLPELVNHFTPSGEVPSDSNHMINQLLTGLSQKI